MEHDDRAYLEHMLDVAVRAHGKVVDRSAEEWESNEDLRLAVTHLVQTLGETAPAALVFLAIAALRSRARSQGCRRLLVRGSRASEGPERLGAARRR